MVEVCASQHLMCVWGSKRKWLMWSWWEMRVWCLVENRFEMKGWKSGVSGEERP